MSDSTEETGCFEVGLGEKGNIIFDLEKPLQQLVMERDVALAVAEKIISLYLVHNERKDNTGEL